MNIHYNNNFSDLCLIGQKYDTDKTPLRINVNSLRHAHPYTLYYNSIFNHIKNYYLNILEFGILKGSSLLMWKEYFYNSKIVGLDNNIYYINKMKEQNFDVSFVDVNDENNISSSLKNLNMMFDIIIEDTTHQIEDQIRVIKNTVEYLKPGGVIIIEDIFLNNNENDYYEKLGETLNEFQNYYFITLDHENKYSEGWNNDKLFVLIKKGAEPIIKKKEKEKITIITPSYRIQNLKKIYETINFDYVDEWIIVYDGSKITENPNLFNHEKIKEYVHYNNNSCFGNAQRNFALNNIKNENTYLYFLDDDNLIHPELYKLLDIIEKDKLYTFNQIRYPNLELLKGNEIKETIDTAMILISYNLCKNIKWNLYEYGADFRYINECYNQNKEKWIYINNVLAYHNIII